MAIVQQNFSTYLRTLRIIFVALIMGQITVLLVLYIVQSPEMSASPAYKSSWITLITSLIAIGLPALSQTLYRKKQAEALGQPDLKTKLTLYRTALLLRWAPLEGLVLFFALQYFLTTQLFMLYGTALFIVLIAVTQWPTRTKIVTALALGTEEQAQLDDPNTVVSEMSQRPG